MSISLDLHCSALLLLDLQRDFVDAAGALASTHGEAGVSGQAFANCRRLAGAMRAAGRPVIFANTVLRADYADSAHPAAWLDRLRTTGALIESSPGAQLAGGLEAGTNDYVVHKKGLSAFHHTVLDRLLTNLRVSSCVVAGSGMTSAVTSTLQSGASLGFKQFLVGDAVLDAVPEALVPIGNRAAVVSTAEVAALCGAPMVTPASPKRPALIIVDMQNDFIHADGVTQRRQAIGTTTELAQLIGTVRDLMVAARARKWPVIVVRAVNTVQGLDSLLNPAHNPLDAALALEGTWGSETVDELRAEACDVEIIKRGNSSFAGTPLHRTLRNLGVNHLLVTGGASSGCVRDTVRDGLEHGYHITVASDATYPPRSPYLSTLATLVDVMPCAAALDKLSPELAASPVSPSQPIFTP